MSEHPDFPAADDSGTLTLDTWLNERHVGIGSTDAPVIAGVSKYKSPLALYHEKRGDLRIEPRDRERIEWGRQLEPLIIERYMRETGREVSWPARGVFQLLRNREHSWMHATLDATVVPFIGKGEGPTPLPAKGAGPLEVKNVSSYIGERWKDEPPIEFIVQVQHQMAVSGAEFGSIAALIGGNLFVWQDVPRDQDFIDILVRMEHEFILRVQRGDAPPADGHESTNELLKRLYPKDNGVTVHLGPEFLDIDSKLAGAKAMQKEYTALVDTFENQMKAAIGDASAAVLPNGTVYTYKTQSRKEYTVKAAEYRVLRRKESLKAVAVGRGPGAALMLPEDQRVEAD